nr:MAG TPA: hypothetical protein [Caudoviricetes sp.]
MSGIMLCWLSAPVVAQSLFQKPLRLGKVGGKHDTSSRGN